MFGFLKKIFGSKSDRELKKIEPIVDKILKMEGAMESLSDDELKNKTNEFKKRLEKGETLDDLLPEAFAVVREASWRVLGMKPYPVQLIGGIILHQGRIAEMKTGEGKTLVSTLPAYLNALEGKGVHIVTVNDYLAKRDKEWMGKVHEFLGLTVGVITQSAKNDERRENYQCDITYGTNNQFGFDYLRDNMVVYEAEQVQRDLHFAIIDEVDSILIDEARTPLIISGRGEDSTDLYARANSFVQTLKGRVMDPDEDKKDPFEREYKVETVDFLVDEKRNTASLTEQGTGKAEKYFGLENLSDINNMEIAHHINQALKANHAMHRDIDYVVQHGEILIVDEFTGRIMEGRRYSDGLHQAIEAKEGVEIRSESKTLATITFQNYFRMYDKMSGMTGTAMTEEEEFSEIYKMDVVEIPTNEPVRRVDEQDQIYVTEEKKYQAIIDEIVEIHETGQPILVGTADIETSELLSKMLRRRGIRHDVLNAKYHEREAEIVAQAGTLNKVTIATNMAGRGTDIILGGNPEFMAYQEMRKEDLDEELLENLDSMLPARSTEEEEAREQYKKYIEEFKKETDENKKEVLDRGGLYIIGTERHESRRIDNQLRGRAGRQGDPGSSKFFISLQDELMRLFGGDAMQRFVESDMFDEDEVIESRAVSRAIERAQVRVESNNFQVRKSVLQYDDVMNVQRKIIYEEREKVLRGEDMHDQILEMLYSIIEEGVESFCQAEDPEDWEMESFVNYLQTVYLPEGVLVFDEIRNLTKEDLIESIYKKSKDLYEEKMKAIGEDRFREIERVILLMVVDRQWMDHIDAMDQLRQGIGLRSFGQQNPVQAYTQEGFDMFEDMNHRIKEDTIQALFNVEEDQEKIQRQRVSKETGTSGGGDAPQVQETVTVDKRVGRNDPCPCGSGKKYKHCCGR